VYLVRETKPPWRVRILWKTLVSFNRSRYGIGVREAFKRALLHRMRLERNAASSLIILELLEQGVPQRDLAKQLGVGIGHVTLGSRAFKELKRDMSQSNEKPEAHLATRKPSYSPFSFRRLWFYSVCLRRLRSALITVFMLDPLVEKGKREGPFF